MSKRLVLLHAASSGMNREDLLADLLSDDWEYLRCTPREEPERFHDCAARADALVGGRVPALPAGAPLRLYQVPFTGYDWIQPAELPTSAVLCNTHEHEATIAEHLLLGMLEFQIGLLRETDPMMRAKSYNGRSINRGPHHRELLGGTVGILGYGQIGREIARRCKAFGMRVMALSRTVREEPGLVDWYGTPAELDTLLAESDFIMVCAPLTEETRGMIDARSFSLMKPDAVIGNVGRGPVIEEAALYAALAGGRIRGAILDVWYRYPSAAAPNPWPSRFPFQSLDNVIMSPHNSAWTAQMSERRWRFVAANLDRFARGEPLLNVCFRGERQD